MFTAVLPAPPRTNATVCFVIHPTTLSQNMVSNRRKPYLTVVKWQRSEKAHFLGNQERPFVMYFLKTLVKLFLSDRYSDGKCFVVQK